ncbi:hypothetical protein [Aureimonas pseudogalii]|uniref:Uncharacterized protein n=1 Tax=Aureimonas pseudogalii TaxID=1744844 RepID=A0A7W6ED31_9HYPH|nr:hypothetical protein [Aureimonas pseudogalii]MBB3996435.1 hypothetical protein [Aureimonas pseudogalii]
MRDVQKALAEIEAIRSGMAAGTVFRGFGPTTLAATGGLALVAAGLQTLYPPTVLVFFVQWIAVALVSVAAVGVEVVLRSRRQHGGLADAMIHQAIQQFLPAGMAGAGFAAVVARCAPDTAWMLPGTWAVLVGLGLFAAQRSLPRAAVLVAAWYFVAGFAALLLSAGVSTPSPFAMGVPFAVGQGLLAIVFLRSPEVR